MLVAPQTLLSPHSNRSILWKFPNCTNFLKIYWFLGPSCPKVPMRIDNKTSQKICPPPILSKIFFTSGLFWDPIEAVQWTVFTPWSANVTKEARACLAPSGALYVNMHHSETKAPNFPCSLNLHHNSHLGLLLQSQCNWKQFTQQTNKCNNYHITERTQWVLPISRDGLIFLVFIDPGVVYA